MWPAGLGFLDDCEEGEFALDEGYAVAAVAERVGSLVCLGRGSVGDRVLLGVASGLAEGAFSEVAPRAGERGCALLGVFAGASDAGQRDEGVGGAAEGVR